jgi:hypothetical protein
MKLRSSQVITATDVVVDQIGKIIGYRSWKSERHVTRGYSTRGLRYIPHRNTTQAGEKEIRALAEHVVTWAGQ